MPYPQANGAMNDVLAQYKNQYQMPQGVPMANSVPMQNQRTPSNDIIWVQGEAGAKAYLVAPSTTVTLWDSENPTIYVKTADASGIPSMRILDFKERVLGAAPETDPKKEHKCTCGKDFVKKKDYEDLLKRFEKIEASMQEMMKTEEEE
jgi:hypothetical protein